MEPRFKRNEKWNEIETGVRNGVSLRDLERKTGVPITTLHRWIKRAGLEKEAELARIKRDAPIERKILVPSVDPEEVENVDFLADLYRIRRDLMALQGDDPRITVQSLDKQIKLIDTLVKVAAELRAQRSEDLHKNPDFIRYENAVLQVLNEFPGAVERLNEIINGGVATEACQ